MSFDFLKNYTSIMYLDNEVEKFTKFWQDKFDLETLVL